MNNTLNERTRALLTLVLGAITISFTPILVKLLGHGLVGPTAIAFWRVLIGGLVLVLIGLFRGQSLRLPRYAALWCLFAGLAFALDLGLWHRAILLVGAGMSTLIGNTHVFATTWISHLVFKEKLTRRFLLAAPAAVLGLALLVGVFNQEVVFTSPYIRGLAFGFCTAVMYALYMLGLKKAANIGSNAMTLMTWICLSCAVFLGVGSFFEELPFFPPDWRSLIILLVMGTVGQAMAWWGIAHAMRRIAIHHAALILLMQPVLAMGWGFLFFGESLGFSQILGAAITLSAIYAGSVKKRVENN